jgi:exonuclease III
MDCIRLASFNCRNVKTSLPDISQLCNSCDVVFLQETWLAPSELIILKHIHPDFYGEGISSFRDDTQLFGRPHGGLGILWRKSLGPSASCIVYPDENRIMGFNIFGSTASLFLLNVYLPYFSGSESDCNYYEFLNNLSKALSLLESSPTMNACILGDFNACTLRPTPFTREMLSFAAA